MNIFEFFEWNAPIITRTENGPTDARLRYEKYNGFISKLIKHKQQCPVNGRQKGNPGKQAMVKIHGKQELRKTGHREKCSKAEHMEADDLALG